MDSKFFVPFETAKQLKEKGYPQDMDYLYDTDGCRKWRHLTLYQMDKLNFVAAPTYHEVVDWLREQYGLIVCVGFSVARCWTWSVGRLREILTLGAYGEKESTREEALNVAILKALEMI